LQRYLEEGVYEIDNSLVENAIRATCLGKKNWLFIGHPDAGWRSAVIYSVLLTARRYGFDPVAGLTDGLLRIPVVQSFSAFADPQMLSFMLPATIHRTNFIPDCAVSAQNKPSREKIALDWNLRDRGAARSSANA
jgi:Transposase IS66 family